MISGTKTSTTTTDLLRGRVVLGLGSNLGDREGSLRLAVEALSEKFGPLRVASLYRSSPWLPPGAPGDLAGQPEYLNTVAMGRLAAPQEARHVLAFLKGLERRAGRRDRRRYAPRPLDVDLLACGELQVDLPALEAAADDAANVEGAVSGEWPGAIEVPHPRLAERRFVLEPLAELAPDLVIPPGRPVRDLLAALGEHGMVERLAWTEAPAA